MAGEFAFIEWVRAQAGRPAGVVVPPGDDLAVVEWSAGDLLVVGVDQVLDGVHFDSAVHSPGDIGRKVMNRNLSDCAAMACLPAAAVATVALPRSHDAEYAKALFLGMTAAADAYGFPIVGGDTASWEGRLVMTVTILGRSAGIEPVQRSGAKVGDGIYVTGPLGGSLLGRHLTFTPRIAEARQLAGQKQVSAMIDLSDGLSRDLRHICRESGVGAILDAEQIPIHDDARALASRDGRPPLEHALHDGEDHELLFTSPVQPSLGTRIGRIVEGPNVQIQRGGAIEILEARGWEHRL